MSHILTVFTAITWLLTFNHREANLQQVPTLTPAQEYKLITDFVVKNNKKMALYQKEEKEWQYYTDLSKNTG